MLLGLFGQATTLIQSQHDPHGPDDDPFIFFWTYQDMMDWMSRILVGGMAGADEDFGSKLGKCG
jgi:hypothetical protein